MSVRSVTTSVLRWGLGGFLFLLIYDGALRKWAFPASEQLLFIAKDALLFGLLAFVIMRRSVYATALLQSNVRALFYLYGAWVTFQIFNPFLPNLLVGIWGFKAHLLYAGLIILVPLAFENLETLIRWLERAFPWIVVPVCGLALFQVLAPADGFVNLSLKGGTEGTSYFGESGLVRVTGTFSYITGMASFVQATTVLGLGLFLGGARSLSFLLGLCFALASLPATGSRSVIVIVAVSSVLMLLAAIGSRIIGPKLAVRMLLIFVLIGAASFRVQDDAWIALQQRAEEARHDERRSISAFTNAFSYFEVAGVVGFGVGSANLGSPALIKSVVPFSWLPIGSAFEEESGRVVLELGVVGWLISQALRISLFLWSAWILFKGRTRMARVASLLAMPVMALGMYQGNGVFSPPVGASNFWFCVALLAMANYEHRQAAKWARENRLHMPRRSV